MITERFDGIDSLDAADRMMASACDGLPCRDACPSRGDFDSHQAAARGCPFWAMLNAWQPAPTASYSPRRA
jgi:hypothetical protein